MDGAVSAYPKDAPARPGYTGDCRAARWNATPVYEGPHEGHLFAYGPHGIYVGYCAGRSE